MLPISFFSPHSLLLFCTSIKVDSSGYLDVQAILNFVPIASK